MTVVVAFSLILSTIKTSKNENDKETNNDPQNTTHKTYKQH